MGRQGRGFEAIPGAPPGSARDWVAALPKAWHGFFTHARKQAILVKSRAESGRVHTRRRCEAGEGRGFHREIGQGNCNREKEGEQ